MRKTKIVCTIGPASENPEVFRRMCLNGLNVARLNFSHGTHEEHQKKIDMIKAVREELNLPIAIMLDTKGPEYRIRTFKGGKIHLNDGDEFTFTTREVEGDEHIVSVSYKGLAEDLAPGDRILVNNGLVIFEVTEILGTEINCKVLTGGVLSDRKSMSFPGKVMRQVYLSEQDKSDLLFGIRNGVDFVAASFVSCKQDMLDNHRELNDLCHKMDPTRFTTLACYAMCGPFNPVAHITDTVSWNLYLGWYVPGLFLNDLWMDFFHKVYPDRCLGYSEYGCEGMPNLHSSHPHRGDHSEEYQAIYHEYMLKCFERHPWMWATHVWNMFDFAADARNQGGEPGMNHKGLITFDRKTRKDSFYLYKAYWSKKPFVHICSKRYEDRTEDSITVKVYSNQNEVSLFVNGDKIETKHGEHIFVFTVPMRAEVQVKATAGETSDDAVFRKVSKPNPNYVLKDSGDKGANWTNKE